MSIHRLLGVSIYFIVGLAFTGCLTPGPAPEAVNVAPLQLTDQEEQVIDRVIIITDASSSVYAEGFSYAKLITQSVISGLPEDSGPLEVGAIAFGGSQRDIVAVGDLDRSRLESYAQNLQPLGGVPGYGGITPTHRVLDEVSAQLDGKSGRTAVILISDGLPSSPERTLAAAKGLVANYNGPLCLHTIQTSMSSKGDAFSRELSEVTNCGSMQTTDQLRTAYDVTSYERSVFAAQMAALPAVAAPPPCESRMELEGVAFAFDSAELTTVGQDALSTVAFQLGECTDVKIRIGGHTDGFGGADYNQSLSERRANAVRNELIKEGVSEDRLDAMGYGDTEPVASNESADGRAQNRRVEFVPEKP